MQLLGSGGDLIASTTFLIGSCGQLLSGLGVIFALALIHLLPLDELTAGGSHGGGPLIKESRSL